VAVSEQVEEVCLVHHADLAPSARTGIP